MGSDSKPHDNPEGAQPPPSEKAAIATKDAQDARLSGQATVQAAQDTNPNKSTGSFAPNLRESFELFYTKENGTQLKSSRHTPLTEKDLSIGDIPAGAIDETFSRPGPPTEAPTNKSDTPAWQQEAKADLYMVRNYVQEALKGHVEFHPGVNQVDSPGNSVIDSFRGMLQDPRRNDGEFQFAIGQRDGKHFAANRYYEPKIYDHNGYERHLNPLAPALEIARLAVDTLQHTHPNHEGKATGEFSEPDKNQADTFQSHQPGITVRSFLLTPQNIVKVYVPKETVPGKPNNGEVVGHYDKTGHFTVTNPKYKDYFAGAKNTSYEPVGKPPQPNPPAAH